MTLDLDKENIVLFGTEGSGHQSKAWVVKNGIEYLIKVEFTGMEQKFKTLLFSSNQEKNLIDIKFAQHICMYIANNINKINNLDIPDFHKFVIKYRLNKILSLR